MNPPSPDGRTPERRARDEAAAAEPPLLHPELPADAAPAPVEAHRQRIKQAWIEEVRRRAAEVDSGQVKPIPWSEIQREIDELLDGH